MESENEIAGLATASMNASDFMEKVRTAENSSRLRQHNGFKQETDCGPILILLVSEGVRERKEDWISNSPNLMILTTLFRLSNVHPIPAT